MIPPYTINRTYPYSIDGSVKNITYIIALMVKNKLFHLSNKITRDKLIHVYNDCKDRERQNEGTEKKIENFINYFYKSIENELTKESKEPSFLCQIMYKLSKYAIIN